jgi:hypothetical protein
MGGSATPADRRARHARLTAGVTGRSAAPAAPATPGRLIRAKDGMYETQTIAGQVLLSVGARDGKPARGSPRGRAALADAGELAADNARARNIHRITTLCLAPCGTAPA